MKRLCGLALVLIFLSGCSSLGKKWKELISGGSAPSAKASRQPQSTSYSQQKSLVPTTYRQYKRVKHKDLKNEARLDSRAGSLWVMEGQGAYLFSQNIVRMIGDPLAIRMEGEPKEQLSQKAEVVSDLLKQLEERRKLARARAKGTPAKKKSEAPAQNPQVPAVANRAPASKDSGPFSVKSVPTRIVERMVDGNYKVRGMQPFMIGSREYKVIVSGIVRSEDFNEQGISATQLLDPKFDIVSSKSSEIR
jgi:flagellar L-ring protein precursor FlgH